MGVSSVGGALSAIFTGQPSSKDTVTVRKGDTLTAIAARNKVPLKDLVAANPQIKDPNKIFPGQGIMLPKPVLAAALGAVADKMGAVLDGLKPVAQPLVTVAGAMAKTQISMAQRRQTTDGLVSQSNGGRVERL